MTIELDKAGLEAARTATALHFPGTWTDEMCLTFVRAYLEATHPPAQGDYAGLVKAMRFHGRYATETQAEMTVRRNAEREDAATAITTLSAELAKVKAERDELDALYHEGGTWEQQLARAESERDEANARAERAEAQLAKANTSAERILTALDNPKFDGIRRALASLTKEPGQ